MPELPTGTVTFLFTDIESSTKLLHELGPAGGIEAEETRGPVGRGWEAQRGEYASHLDSVAGPEFEQGRREGSTLSLDEAVEYALGSLN
jgi:hypothetical protein